jgi:hypothetical protein
MIKMVHGVPHHWKQLRTMTSDLTLAGVGLCALVPPKFFCAPHAERPAPIYSVTVISNGLAALNYQDHIGTTKIDFKRTVLAPGAHGQTVAESKEGSIELIASLLTSTPRNALAVSISPTFFGRLHQTDAP